MKEPQKTLMHDFAQTIYGQVLNASVNSPMDRFKTKIFNRLLTVMVESFNDPLVTYSVGGFPLSIPLSHQLPFILKKYPYYSLNLVRIARHAKQKYEDLRFIDVGANIGDSIALLRKEVYFPILCIEGDEQFYPILEGNKALFTDVELAKCYVGESTLEIKSLISRDGGTAHINQDANQASLDQTSDVMIKIERLSDVLQERPSFLVSKMIKIDTDGFDCKILRGAIDFLVSAKPIVFFEYDPFFLAQQNDNNLLVFELFRELNYKYLLIYDNLGDLMLSTQTDNSDTLEEIHAYFSGRMGRQYCDICAFHMEDADLFQDVRRSEIQFSKALRG